MIGIKFCFRNPKCKITDSVNRGIVKGHYAEMYKKQDSMFVTKRVAVNFVENDCLYSR
jgi:hypothetical protein